MYNFDSNAAYKETDVVCVFFLSFIFLSCI